MPRNVSRCRMCRLTGSIRLEPGDTIYTVANRYKVTPRRIILANNLAPPYDLSSYRQLNIPKPRTHRVVAGETLDSISNRYLVRKEDVIRLNALDAPYTLRPGMQIAIPRRMDYSLLDDATGTTAALAPVPDAPAASGGAAARSSVPNREVRFAAGAGDFTWPGRWQDHSGLRQYGTRRAQ